MCNLYSITNNQAVILALLRAVKSLGSLGETGIGATTRAV